MFKSETQNLTFAIISEHDTKKLSKFHITMDYDAPILN
jgi:hypothetical protein